MLRGVKGAAGALAVTECEMQKGWAGWLSFVVLCGLVLVSSCNAWRADPSAGTETSAGTPE